MAWLWPGCGGGWVGGGPWAVGGQWQFPIPIQSLFQSHRRGRSLRAPASQCCRRGMGCPELRKTSTISAAQYTTCKSPTLRCRGAGADPPASVPAPWYFFRSARNAYVLLGPWKHRPPSHRGSQATARPQSGHSQVTVRSQSGHSQVTVRSWFFIGKACLADSKALFIK